MERSRQILGKTTACTATEALLLLEAAVCEGLLLPPQISAEQPAQVFGRKTHMHRSTDLSYLSGLAGGGLRAAAFIRAADLAANGNRLRELARNHIPALIICLTDRSDTGRAPVAAIRESGCFMLSAGNAQEAVHLALLGHRVAEAALTPGILLVSSPSDEKALANVVFPEAQTLAAFLGEPDDPIAAPTPAQEIIFGKKRRRIPNWRQFDYPTLTGAGKQDFSAALEQAANQRFFENELPKLLETEFQQFKNSLPGASGALRSYQAETAQYLLLSTACDLAAELVDELRSKDGIRAGYVHLAQLHPLPIAELTAVFSGKKAVTWLEPDCTQQKILPEESLQNRIASLGKNAPEWYFGRLATQPDPDTLRTVFQNMLPKGGHLTNFIAGIEFIRATSDYPQHDVLLQSIRQHFPEANQWSLPVTRTAATTPEPSGSHTLPPAVYRQQDLGPPYARAARFYHNVAVLHTDGALHELVADPFQAIPVAPAGAAQLAGSPPERALLPAFKPELCTGCGECLVHCPHAALPPLAIRFEHLLRGGMDIAAKRGAPLSQLTPLLKNLGKMAGQIVRETGATDLARILPEAFSLLADQLKPDAEKREKIQAEMEQVVGILAPMQFAFTETFFTRPEQYENGSGALFALALDTQACTGCGICAAVCEPRALVMTDETPELREQAGAAQEIREKLPDTAPELIQRLSQDETYNPFAAILLSRHYYNTLGGPGSAADAPRKALLHLLTALTESVEQPEIAAQCRELEQTIHDLAENIHQLLGEALPAESSKSLFETIAAAAGRRLPLDEIIASLSAQEHLKLIDTAVLQRKIELVDSLKELLWALKEGPTGLGRARYGLFFPGDQPEAASAFPFHPYQAPVLVSRGGSLETALGVFEANLRHTIDNIRLLRRAKLEIKNQYRPGVHAAAIAGLDWEHLEEQEKKLVPPLLVVCRLEALPENFLEQLPRMLARNFPIKIVVLDAAALPPDEPAAIHFGLRNTLLQAAMNSGNTAVFMGSAGDPRVLFNALLSGIRSHQPAFCVLHCYEPARHTPDAANWPEVYQLALYSRAMPFFQAIPDRGASSRATTISLKGNPSEKAAWAEGGDGRLLTFADWLFNLSEWKDHFWETPEAGTPVCALPEYLRLSAAERAGKIPVFHPKGEQDYRVSEQVVSACEAALSAWNQLREMAGALSDFPEKIWQEAEKTQTAVFEARLQEIEKGYQERMQNLEQEFLEKTRVRLREKLLSLAMQKNKVLP